MPNFSARHQLPACQHAVLSISDTYQLLRPWMVVCHCLFGLLEKESKYTNYFR